MNTIDRGTPLGAVGHLKSFKGYVTQWPEHVVMTNEGSVADFVNSLPHASVGTMDDLHRVFDGAVEVGLLPTLSIELTKTGFEVAPAYFDPNAPLVRPEWFSAVGGTHMKYGNFAALWSCRGPGNGARPRPCFLFWDGDVVFISDGQSPDRPSNRTVTAGDLNPRDIRATMAAFIPSLSKVGKAS